ncbi:MAG: hypothetical protein P1U42_09295 [Phycisphaerales bacterium]|nr:hypothetical protein [Phycisphaerales bacterium]
MEGYTSVCDTPVSSLSTTLKLVGDIELKTCPECMGVGRVACPQTVAVRTIGFNGVATLQPSTGHPIPCPNCLGKKNVPNI